MSGAKLNSERVSQQETITGMERTPWRVATLSRTGKAQKLSPAPCLQTRDRRVRPAADLVVPHTASSRTGAGLGPDEPVTHTHTPERQQ